MPVPEPAPGEIRVRVAAVGANPVDNAILQGYMKDMLEHRFPLVPGIDASGTIDAVADDVKTWKVGDAVFGASGKSYFGAGTYAEYATMSEGSVASKPSSLQHEQAAAIPTAGVTALMLLDALEPQEGDVVLAIGAVGGVGSYFVQLAAQRGARVIAVSRSINADYVRSLGAEDLIDYTSEDIGEAIAARHDQGIDAIADMVGNKEELASAIRRVKAGGRVASCVGAVDEGGLAQRDLSGRNVRAVVTTERLELLAAGRTSGRWRDPDIESLPLDQASEALARLAGRHVRGKLVLKP
jgi:NADPH:quinone reductase-like Zn-dependent oxidoreductase